VGLSQRGVDGQRALECGGRFLEATEHAQRVAEMAVDLGVVTLEGEDLSVLRDRLLVSIELGEHKSQVAVRLEKTGGAGYCPPQVSERLLRTVERAKRGGQVVVCFGVILADRQDFLIVSGGFLRAAEREQGIAKVVERVNVPGTLRQYRPVARDRLVGVIECREDDAKAHLGIGEMRNHNGGASI